MTPTSKKSVAVVCVLANLNVITGEETIEEKCTRYEGFLNQRYPVSVSCQCGTKSEGVTEGPVFMANCTTPNGACAGNNIPFQEYSQWTGKQGSFKSLHSHAERLIQLTDTGDVIRLVYEREPYESQDATSCKLFVAKSQNGSFENTPSSGEQECNSCELRKECTSETDTRFFANCTNVILGTVIDQCTGAGYEGTIFQVLDRAVHSEGSCPIEVVGNVSTAPNPIPGPEPPSSWSPPEIVSPAPTSAVVGDVNFPTAAPEASPPTSTLKPEPAATTVELTSGVSMGFLHTSFVLVLVLVASLMTL